MTNAEYLAVGRIFLEETKAAMPMPKALPEARLWRAALIRKCQERSRAEQSIEFEEWQLARPDGKTMAAYGKMAERLSGLEQPS